MMTREEAKQFTTEWLPAWTGNQPEKLVSFYSKDAFYSDPAIPQGVTGREQLLKYFNKLLAANPNWVWTNTDAIPMAGGFLNMWHAKIPVGSKVIECDGVCLVMMREGLITRNQVYFDRTELMEA